MHLLIWSYSYMWRDPLFIVINYRFIIVFYLDRTYWLLHCIYIYIYIYCSTCTMSCSRLLANVFSTCMTLSKVYLALSILFHLRPSIQSICSFFISCHSNNSFLRYTGRVNINRSVVRYSTVCINDFDPKKRVQSTSIFPCIKLNT